MVRWFRKLIHLPAEQFGIVANGFLVAQTEALQ